MQRRNHPGGLELRQMQRGPVMQGGGALLLVGEEPQIFRAGPSMPL